MDYIRGDHREQSLLLPERVEDYVSEANPVRFIDAFVDGLDLEELGFEHSGECGSRRGRPAYYAGDLLKLYIYGYLNRVRSSRRLESETHRNLEVIWLLRKLRPDHKTIAEFRRKHGVQLRKVFQEFHQLCRKLDLFGRLVAIDGSVIKADNNLKKVASEDRLAKQIAGIDERIEEYLKQLESQDEEEEGQGGSEVPELAEKIEHLKQTREQCDQLRKELAETGEKKRALVDSESRRLKKNGRHVVGYNVQVAVEAKEHLIVAEEVTLAGNDNQQLEPMATSAAEALAPEEGEGLGQGLQVLADAGYENYQQIVDSEGKGIEIHLPLREEVAAREGLFTAGDFSYDEQTDEVICPNQERLSRKKDSIQPNRHHRVYMNTRACRECPLKAQCTKSKYRKFRIYVHEDVLERVRNRLKQTPEIYAQRQGVVEHVFGSIKQWMEQDHFLCRGLSKVQGEFALSCLAYNMRRVLNISTVPELLSALARA